MTWCHSIANGCCRLMRRGNAIARSSSLRDKSWSPGSEIMSEISYAGCMIEKQPSQAAFCNDGIVLPSSCTSPCILCVLCLFLYPRNTLCAAWHTGQFHGAGSHFLELRCSHEVLLIIFERLILCFHSLPRGHVVSLFHQNGHI